MTHIMNNYTRRVLLALCLACTACITTVKAQDVSQDTVRDTVVVELAHTSRIIFTIEDKDDLEILKHYNFQQLFDDILTQIESHDTTATVVEATPQTEDWAQQEEEAWRLSQEEPEKDIQQETAEANENADWKIEWQKEWKKEDRFSSRLSHSLSFDLGTNNYLEDGKFPDSEDATYSVRPWGSWYLGINSVHRMRLKNDFFMEWALGISWYTFKFQQDNARMIKDSEGVTFVEDDLDASFKKSKLSASYLNAYLMFPVLDLSDQDKKSGVWNGYGDSFRVGLGGYAGYRINSHSKVVYEQDGDTEKDKDWDSFYLHNMRYGLRLQLGYRFTDLFFNYDLNDLFTAGKGPSLNAFSFGLVF